MNKMKKVMGPWGDVNLGWSCAKHWGAITGSSTSLLGDFPPVSVTVDFGSMVTLKAKASSNSVKGVVLLLLKS
jgi:hypothetical protein